MNKHEEAKVLIGFVQNDEYVLPRYNMKKLFDYITQCEATEKSYEERLDLLAGRLVDKESKLEKLVNSINNLVEYIEERKNFDSETEIFWELCRRLDDLSKVGEDK